MRVIINEEGNVTVLTATGNLCKYMKNLLDVDSDLDPVNNSILKFSTISNKWEIGTDIAPVTSVNDKTGVVVLDADDIDEGVTNKYYTEAKVSANSDVSANTAKRHDAVTVTDSSEIDFTLTGQDLTASIKPGSIDETKLDTSVNASLDLADSSIQPLDNISSLTNDSGFITSSGTIDNITQITNRSHTDLSDIGTNTHAQIDSHISNTSNPHSVDKIDVGLGNVANVDTTNASNITTGTLPSSVIPPIAITETFTAANETEQLALTVQKGDVCVRTDENKSYINSTGNNTAMSDWQELLTPTDSVLSVNSQTGSVVLTTGDINTVTDKNYVTDSDLTNLSNLSGTNTGDQVISDATISITDITTNNVSTLKHGFAPKGDGSTDKFLNANGTYSTPTGGGTVTSVAISGSDGLEVDSGSPITTSGTIALGVDKTAMLSHLNVEDGAEVNNISDINATDLTDAGDSSLHYHSSDRNRSNHTGTQTASTISDFDTEVANNSAVTANTAKVTNATHTGEVTGSTVLTIADNVVDEANLKISNAPTNDYVLTADSAVTGGMKWAASSGGGSSDSVNVESLTADKTLVAGTDDTVQYLDPNGANRTVTLSTTNASEGDKFIIINNGIYNTNRYLSIVLDSTVVGKLYISGKVHYIYDGTNWRPVTTGSFSGTNNDTNINIGKDANGNNQGVAIGKSSDADAYGVAIGVGSKGIQSGVGIGYNAKVNLTDVVIGYYARSSGRYSVALGYFSKCERYNELTNSIDHELTNKNNWSVIGLKGSTTNATETELFCAGVTNQRIKIIANSALGFKAMVTAKQDGGTDCKYWEVSGLIKRDGSNNTAIVGSITKTVIAEETGASAWDCDFTADDTNEALKVTVTGAASTNIDWTVRVDTSETRN